MHDVLVCDAGIIWASERDFFGLECGRDSLNIEIYTSFKAEGVVRLVARGHRPG